MTVIFKPLFMIVGYVLALVPSYLRQLFGNSVGYFLRLLRFRTNIVLENLGRAHSYDSHFKIRPLYASAYSHIGKLFTELFVLFGPYRFFSLHHTVLLGKENWDSAFKQGKGVLFLSSHVGNWELMTAAGGLSGIDLLMVTKRLRPKWLHDAIEKARLSVGVKGTYEPRTLKDVLSHLRGGGTVGIVLDQYAGPPIGMRVPFFGVPVGTSTALATLAKRTGALVVPVVNYRQGGKFYIQIEQSIPWIINSKPETELALNTARYVECLERHIKTYPGQWLWTHRRFKGNLNPLADKEWETGRARK